ncbi:hypothetical protein K8I31_20885, partial [bacterium]|nr:hypothetical protein [bacterium]
YYLLFNASDEFAQGEIQLPDSKAYVVVDFDSGKSYQGTKNEFGLSLSMKPWQSVCVMAASQADQDLPAWNVERPSGKSIDISKDWTIQLAGKALDEEWTPELKETRVELPLFKTKMRFYKKRPGWETPQFDDSEWETRYALRGNALFPNPSTVLYRAILPPGAKAIETPIPAEGAYAVWLNGRLVEKRLTPPQQGRIDFADATGRDDLLALETFSHSGMAGLNSPLEVVCGSTKLDKLTSWQDLDFGYYAGRVLYKKTVSLDSKPDRIWLDLGEVQHHVEVYVNGDLAGLLLWPPYEMEITDWVHEGENELAFVISNTLGNRFAWDVWGTRGSGQAEPSGILGPARLWVK